MIELGKIQWLEIMRVTQIGAYLNSIGERDEEDILLPLSQLPTGAAIGDEIEVFVYKDSQDRPIATAPMPKLTVGELAMLKVVEVTRIGAFLDWGLEKDLLLPFKEQTMPVEAGQQVLVGLYVDKSRRLCATMEVYKFLQHKSPFKKNQKVQGTIYKINCEAGAFVAVENKYHGLIPNKELFGKFKYGDRIEARVLDIKQDGKLELSLRAQTYHQIPVDSEKIYSKLLANGGKLALNDNSDPALIKATLNMSKAAFKRAIGKLLKEGKIEITQNGIKQV
jgi:predicted RNA-binding protein (virulence factor B family)